MLGAATIAQLDRPRQSRRAETAELLARTAEIACDNAALGAPVRRADAGAAAESSGRRPKTKPESGTWLRNMLLAPLSDAELAAIGIVT